MSDLTKAQVDVLLRDLHGLVDEARRAGRMIHCWYQDLWWTPDQFERDIDAGRFRWGRQNFTLRQRDERTAQLRRAAASAQDELRRWAAGGDHE